MEAAFNPMSGARRSALRFNIFMNEADGGAGREERSGRRGGPRRGGHGRPGRGNGGPFGPSGDPADAFGPMGGPRGPHRHGGRRGHRARRGDVRLAALLLIAEEPRNGYQIIQELDARTDGRWKPSPGAIYPALNQLEDEGLIRLSGGETGKSYEVTDAGKEQADAAASRPALWEHEEENEERPGAALTHEYGQLWQALGAIAQSGDEALIAKATAEVQDLKRKLYQFLADA